jgi:hypothetical protein
MTKFLGDSQTEEAFQHRSVRDEYFGFFEGVSEQPSDP